MKRIYLDVSCLNRPFDDQRQERVRLEAEAIRMIFERVDASLLEHVSSQMAEIEVRAIRDRVRRRRVWRLLPVKDRRSRLSDALYNRAGELMKLGIKAADALHVAAAEEHAADAFFDVRCAFVESGATQRRKAARAGGQSAGLGSRERSCIRRRTRFVARGLMR